MSIGERLRIARKQRGLSDAALAEQAGVSQKQITCYEQGQMVPDSQTLIRLAKVLGVSVEWLMRPVTVTAPAYINQQVQDWLERYLEIEDILGEQLSFVKPEIERTIKTPEEAEQVAEALRQAWNLGENDPIPSMIDTLEKHGIRVGFMPVANNDGFDTLVFSLEANDVVMLVKADIPGDQQRFRLACELGYLMLEMPLDWDCEHIQKATNRFAAAFLVPRTAAFRELGSQRTSLDFSELYSLKHYYGLSIKAWIDRAYDLAVISEDTKQQLVHLFHQQGWHLQEPGDPYPPEKSNRLEQMVLRALRKGLISKSRATELLGYSLTNHTQFERS